MPVTPLVSVAIPPIPQIDENFSNDMCMNRCEDRSFIEYTTLPDRNYIFIMGFYESG